MAVDLEKILRPVDHPLPPYPAKYMTVASGETLVIRNDAGEELLEFVEATGMPILTRNLARGLVPDDHDRMRRRYPQRGFHHMQRIALCIFLEQRTLANELIGEDLPDTVLPAIRRLLEEKRPPFHQQI